MSENLQSAIRNPQSAIEASAIKILRGTTWAHTRGFAPLVTTAQVFSDFNPEVEIVWDKRSLWAFGEGPLEELAAEYDLLVFDHPFTGYAAEKNLLLALDEHLDESVLLDLKQHSVGPSYQSYSYGGHQWALPVDAAAQVSASCPDLLAQYGLDKPRTWQDVIALARETKRVVMPFTRMGTLGAFFTLCAASGEPLFKRRDESHLVSRDTGQWALAQLAALFALTGADYLQLSPVQVLNRMSTTEAILYVPLIYGYSNYARDGYAPHKVAFHDIPVINPSGEHHGGATLGGAGLAISARTKHPAEALRYVAWVCGAECQRATYTLSGGQPAHRRAWEDETANQITGNFFRDTLRTLDAAYLRPNYNGFHHFQTRAAECLHDFLLGKQSSQEVLRSFDVIYQKSKGTMVSAP